MSARISPARAALCAAALLGALGVPAAAAPQAVADAAQPPEAAQAQNAQQGETARPDAGVQGILTAVMGGLVVDGRDVSVPEGTDVQIVVQGGGVWVYQAATGTEGAQASAEVPDQQETADASADAAAPAAEGNGDAEGVPAEGAQAEAPTWVDGADGAAGSWDTHGAAAEDAALASLSGGAYALQADGSGTGSAAGFYGDVSVSAEVAGGTVTLSATLPEGEELSAEDAQAYLDALAQGGEVDAVSGSTVTCGALRDAAAAALVAATDGLEPSAPAEAEAWSSTPLEEATLRAAALAEALEGRSVVADDGTRAEAQTVTWVVVGQDSAPDAAVAWQPAVQPASGDAHDLLVEDGTGAQGWWSSPEAQQPAQPATPEAQQPAADPGQTVTPPSDQGAQTPDQGTEQQPAETPDQGGTEQTPDQGEGTGDETTDQGGETGEGDLPAEGGEDPTMPDGTPVEDVPSIDVDPTVPDQGEGTGEETPDQGSEGTETPDGGQTQQPDQGGQTGGNTGGSDQGSGQQTPAPDQGQTDPVDPPQGGTGSTGDTPEQQPEKVWVVDSAAWDEQVWVVDSAAWDEQVWVVDVPASTTQQWVVDSAAWDEQVWVPNQVWVETSAAWDEPVYTYESVCNTCGAIITGFESEHLVASAEQWVANGYQGTYCQSYSTDVPVQTGTVHHDAQGYWEDQGYWSTVHHDEVGHWETVQVPEQGHYETVHHDEVGHYETVHHDEVGHWEWR